MKARIFKADSCLQTCSSGQYCICRSEADSQHASKTDYLIKSFFGTSRYGWLYYHNIRKTISFEVK